MPRHLVCFFFFFFWLLLLLQVSVGDKVLYFKYAGDNMETPGGDKFVVLREDDILCKA